MNPLIPGPKSYRPQSLRYSCRAIWISALVVPGILLVLAESIHRGGVLGLISWILSEPHLYVESLVFLAAVYLAVLAVSLSPWLAAWVLTFPLIFCVSVSYSKTLIREIPLMPWNTVLIKELVSVIGEVSGLTIIFVLSITPTVALLVLTYRLFGMLRVYLGPRSRMLLLVACAMTLLLLARAYATADYREGTLERYSRYGFIRTFISYAASDYMPRPQGYSPKVAHGILSHYGETTRSEARPDIIIVQGEAFWDPTLLKNLKLTVNPVPNLHRLQQEAIGGTLIVNSYGGNTTNTEFEVLTGLSMSLVQPDLAGYTDILRQGIGRAHVTVPSLPAHLLDLGYQTEAIHPYSGTLLNYDSAFRALGFQRFASQADFRDATKKGKYISDAAVYDKIVEMYESHCSRTPDKPYFLFAVTIQNHYDYSMRYYPGEDAGFVAEEDIPRFSTSELDSLRGYLVGVNSTDTLLGNLTRYLSGSRRPVVLVFYGDHLPSLGKGTEFYQKAGLFLPSYPAYKSSYSEVLKLHTVPWVCWDNFTHAGAKASLASDRSPGLSESVPSTMSASYLQSFVLSRYSIPMSRFHLFQQDALNVIPDLGLAAWPATPESRSHESIALDRASAEEWLEQYRILQYYLLNH